jgi:hypothetical protein
MLSRILAVVLLLAGFWCLGQQEGRSQCLLGVCGKPLAASSLLLDKVSATPLLAYSTRKLRAAYAGSALQAQTSASGNATANIGYTADDLNATALGTLIGSNNGAIATWYDQSGNGNNLTPSTFGFSFSPLIANSGVPATQNSHVWAQGQSANNTFLQSATLSMPQPVTLVALFKFDSTAANNSIDGDGTLNFGMLSSGPVYSAGGGSTYSPSGPPTPDTSVHSVVVIASGASSQIIIDGTVIGTTGNMGTTTVTGVNLWATVGNSHIGEFIIFNGALSSGNQSIIRSDYQSWWGAP